MELRLNTATCSRCTSASPGKIPTRYRCGFIPLSTTPWGGLWVDYHLMSTVPGLFVLGEANFSDHGANRLGASALMQGLADGYFVIPYTLGAYLASTALPAVTPDHEAFAEAEAAACDRLTQLLAIQGDKTVMTFHRELGRILWDCVGMARNRAGLETAIARIQDLRAEFWQNLAVPGSADTLNKNLEFAGRVADFMELGELMARDALHREESCGGHFREEHQTADNEAKRDDAHFAYVAAWEYRGGDGVQGSAINHRLPELHQEALTFDNVQLTQRSYK
jgi:succinate dehydrogenase / fumarate reductase flavoprotein subunit